MSAALVEFVRTNRGPMDRWEIAGLLATLGRHGAEWPRCSAEQWHREIEASLKSGELCENESGLIFAPPVKSNVSKQLSLF